MKEQNRISRRRRRNVGGELSSPRSGVAGGSVGHAEGGHVLLSGPAGRNGGSTDTGMETSRVRLARLAVQYVSPHALHVAFRTLRKADAKRLANLKAAIKRFGVIMPIVLDGGERVVAGELRLAAARELGLAEVPVIRLEHLSEAELRAYRIADNRIAERAVWDLEALRAELADIHILLPELSVESMGFEIGEYEVLVDTGDLSAGVDEQTAPPSTSLLREGDVFCGDGHIIACANACDAGGLAALVGLRSGDKRVGVVFADPPYGVPVRGHMGGKGRVQHREFVMGSRGWSATDMAALHDAWLRSVLPLMEPGVLAYICMDWRGGWELEGAFRKTGLEHVCTCVWDKQVAGMGSFYRSRHELVYVVRKPGAPHRNNVQLGRFGRSRDTIWSYRGMAGFGPERDEALAMHPTVKPVALVADILRDSTAPGDVVLDPFGGSGTTLIAAQQTGRKAIILDLDPVYVETILRRYERVFGRAPLHRETGLSVDALCERRSRAAPAASPAVLATPATTATPASAAATEAAETASAQVARRRRRSQ